MALQVNYLENGTGVEFIATATMYGQDILDAKTQLYNSKQFREQRYHIIDRTNCSEFYVSAEDIQPIAELNKEGAELNKKIIMTIVSPKIMLEGIAKLSKTRIEDYVFLTESFRDHATAHKWVVEHMK